MSWFYILGRPREVLPHKGLQIPKFFQNRSVVVVLNILKGGLRFICVLSLLNLFQVYWFVNYFFSFSLIALKTLVKNCIWVKSQPLISLSRSKMGWCKDLSVSHIKRVLVTWSRFGAWRFNDFSSDFDRRKTKPLIYIKFWKQACLPCLLFGAELLSLNKSQLCQLERCQQWFLKNVFYVPKFAPASSFSKFRILTQLSLKLT